MLDQREPFYRLAELAVDTEGRDPEDLARTIEGLVNETGRELAPPR
jgi:hypothetical protein